MRIINIEKSEYNIMTDDECTQEITPYIKKYNSSAMLYTG